MNKEELYEKWKGKVKTHLEKKKEAIPEMDTKAFLKENISTIALDINTLLQLSGQEISIVEFVKDIIEHGTTIATPGRGSGGSAGNPHLLPGLNFYDNHRDYYAKGKFVNYQGTFGKWPGQ